MNETIRVDNKTGEILDTEDGLTGDEDQGQALEGVKSGTALIKVPPLTQDPAIIRYSEESLRINITAQKFSVTCLGDSKQAVDSIILIRGMRKQIEEKEKEWLEPLKEHEKQIREAFALLKKPLEMAENTYRAKDKEWGDKQDELARIAEQQRLLNEQAIKLAQETGTDVVEVTPVIDAPELAKTVHSELGSASKVVTWKWRWREGLSLEEKMQRLPLKYHLANDKVIGQLVRSKSRNGVTEKDFGGVIEIYEDSNRRYR